MVCSIRFQASLQTGAASTEQAIAEGCGEALDIISDIFPGSISFCRYTLCTKTHGIFIYGDASQVVWVLQSVLASGIYMQVHMHWKLYLDIQVEFFSQNVLGSTSLQ